VDITPDPEPDPITEGEALHELLADLEDQDDPDPELRDELLSRLRHTGHR